MVNTPALIIPAAARAIREAIDTGRLNPAAFKILDATCRLEADVQSLWVAIARRPELASVHAQSIAMAIIAEAEEKAAKAKTPKAHKKALQPAEPWMYALKNYRGSWLRGGVVVVAWSGGGLGKLGWKSQQESKPMGIMPAWPDVSHALDGGVTFRIEFKRPGKVSAKTGKRGAGVPITGAQLATLKALSAAGHPSVGASSLLEAATAFVKTVRRLA